MVYEREIFSPRESVFVILLVVLVEFFGMLSLFVLSLVEGILRLLCLFPQLLFVHCLVRLEMIQMSILVVSQIFQVVVGVFQVSRLLFGIQVFHILEVFFLIFGVQSRVEG